MKRLLILLTALLLSGCGAKFVYNNLAMISPWYVDDFVDLDREQAALYQSHLQDIHQWHRTHELPEYHRLLSELRDHLDNTALDEAFLSSHLLQLRQRWQVLITRATPALTEMAKSLTDEQIQSLQQALEEANQERLEEADSPAQHRKDIQKGIARWLGKLTPQQQQWVADFAGANPDRSEATVRAHRAFQQQLFTLLAQRGDASFDSAFAVLLADPLNSDAGRLLNEQRMQSMQQRIGLYQRLWQSASDKQKGKVVDRLEDTLDDLESLMNK